MNILCTLITVAVFVLAGWVILGWVVMLGRIPWGHPVRRLYDLLGRGINPILQPIRSVMPPVRIGNAALDLSVIALFVVLWILQAVIC